MRNKTRLSFGLIALGVMLGLAVLVARGPIWLAFVALLVAWAGVAYAER